MLCSKPSLPVLWKFFSNWPSTLRCRRGLLQASKTPTQTQKASSQSLQSPRQSRSDHLQRRETSKEQGLGKVLVVEQPPASIGHRQPSTHGLVNGQDSNEQIMRHTIPMPMSNAGCFGGGSVFQAMIRPSPALHGFIPDNAYGAMQAGNGNPMYDAQNLNMAGRPGGNFGSGMPLLIVLAYDNLTPKGKPKDYKEGGQAVKFDTFHGTHDKLKALLFLQQFDAAFAGGNFTESSKIRKAATFLKTNALQWWTTLLSQEGIKPSDVGLDENAPIQHGRNATVLGRANYRKGKVSPPISYLHLYECEDFSMGIFCLPSSAVIPLHNHPGMTVISKLLYGSMHVKAYDWVDHADVSYPRLAKLAVDRVMSAPCETAVLYPKSGGNMHLFTAVTPCAVLDVLAPPYSSEDGRHCTYFKAFPYASRAGRPLTEDQRKELSPQELVWMEEFQPPSDFVVKPVPYKGPPITP
ncbi:hypothetical protein L7F22_028410 [Adiantum nelumboides]|nr:hypothetical protein [Adiantum nelumboides]